MILSKGEKSILYAFALLPVSVAYTVALGAATESLLRLMGMRDRGFWSVSILSLALLMTAMIWNRIWKSYVAYDHRTKVITWVVTLLIPLLNLGFCFLLRILLLVFDTFEFDLDMMPVLIASCLLSCWMAGSFLLWPAREDSLQMRYRSPCCASCGTDLSEQIETTCPGCGHETTIDELWDTCVLPEAGE